MRRTKHTVELMSPVKEPSKAQIAREWLMVEFADGRNRNSVEVIKKAEREGIKRDALDRARDSLRFQTISHGRSGATWIPPYALPTPE